MLKITMEYNGKKRTLLASEQKPVKEILAENKISIGPSDKVIVNGQILSSDDIGKSVLEMGFTESPDVTISVDVDLPWDTSDGQCEGAKPQTGIPGSVIYPPKVSVIGCACIVFSAFSPEELLDMKRYMPDALVMRDEKGEPVFAIDIDEKSPGSMNEYGAVFSTKTTSDGNATITIIIDPDCNDAEELAREKLGSAVLNLVKMEECMMKKMKELEERKKLLNEYIRKR